MYLSTLLDRFRHRFSNRFLKRAEDSPVYCSLLFDRFRKSIQKSIENSQKTAEFQSAFQFLFQRNFQPFRGSSSSDHQGAQHQPILLCLSFLDATSSPFLADLYQTLMALMVMGTGAVCVYGILSAHRFTEGILL